MFSPFAYMGSHGTPPVILYDIELYGDNIITSQAILQNKLSGETITYFDRTGTNVKADSSTNYTISQNFSGSTATSIKFGKATGATVSSTFRFMPNLQEVNFPNLTSGQSNMFTGDTNLTTGYFDSLNSLGASMFISCTNVKRIHSTKSGSGIIYLPSISGSSIVNSSIFAGSGLSGSFSTVSASADSYLPVTFLANTTFNSCYSMSKFELPGLTSVSGLQMSSGGNYNLINRTASQTDPNAGVYIPDANNVIQMYGGIQKLNLPYVTTIGEIKGSSLQGGITDWVTISQTDPNADCYIPNASILGNGFVNGWGINTSNTMSMYLPNITTMTGNSQFASSNIHEFSNHPSYSADVWLPNCTILGNAQTFYNAYRLKKVYFDRFTTIPQVCFYGCNLLTSISQTDDTAAVYMPDVTSLQNAQIFSNCTSLTSVDIPYVVSLQSNSIFSGCTNLNYINAPALTSTYIGNSAASNSVFLNCALSGSATFPTYYSTNNAGAPDGDIQYLITRGWTITYV